MLGHLLVLSLALFVLPFVFIQDVLADSLNVELNKEEYHFGDVLLISGSVQEIGMPVLAMSIYDPEGRILSANNLEISSKGHFSKTISLSSPSYEKPGDYVIELEYRQLSETKSFTILSAELESDGSDRNELESNKLHKNETGNALVFTDKLLYNDKDLVTIYGSVSELDSPTVLLGVYDPFGMPTGFYFGTLDSNKEFSTSFPVKAGVNFRIDGTYVVKAHYGDLEASVSFDFQEELDEKAPTEKAPTEKAPTEKTNSSSKIVNPRTDSENSKNFSDDLLSDETKKYDNLSIEDIELGKLLNQINLECDSSTYVDTISYYDGMGPALYRLCNFEDALTVFDQTLLSDPNNVKILVNKGSALGKLGYFSEAIMHYDHAINIDSDFLPAINNKANALANIGKYEDALILYNKVLEKNPNYLTAKTNLETVALEFTRSSVTVSKEITPDIEVSVESKEEKVHVIENDSTKTSNLFEEISNAFSNLGSLFKFLN